MIKPSLIVCYICGMQYGTKSITWHQAFCIKRFAHQNQIPLKNVPNPPEQPYGPAYNQAALQIYKKKILKQCNNCKRTFFPQSLNKHKKGCRPFGEQPQLQAYTFINPKQPPPMLICLFCGKGYGTLSFKPHLIVCQRIQKKRGMPCQADLPQNLNQLLKLSSWNSRSIKHFYQKRSLKKCKRCERRFEENALKVHEKVCEGPKEKAVSVITDQIFLKHY